MKKQDIMTLKLLETLGRDPRQTQRDLAEELNISLGQVNFFIKHLVRKGFFKICDVQKKRSKYIITPKGSYERTRLTYKFIIYSLEFYKETRLKIKSLYDDLSKRGKKRIFIIGANEMSEIVLITLQESDLKLAGIIDNKKAGGMLLGTQIMDLSLIKNALPNDIAILTKTNKVNPSIDELQKYFLAENIIDLENPNIYG